MNESPDTTGCDGMAVRPTITMHKYGNLVAAFPTATYADRIGDYDPNITYDTFAVELWFQSPTGDQSDSQTFYMEVTNWEQGRIISETWRSVWNIPQYGTDAEPTDATGRPNQSNPRYAPIYGDSSVV